jgi:response regulator RpfG family c-di-GMP phosphodiesterase
LGLKGEQIPLPARLFAVVEVWDRLSCTRVYGDAWPQEKITQHIQEQSGSHFDPQVVELFFQSQKQSTGLST